MFFIGYAVFKKNKQINFKKCNKNFYKSFDTCFVIPVVLFLYYDKYVCNLVSIIYNCKHVKLTYKRFKKYVRS